ncbi:serine/threonine-protein kinase [Phytohabitans sp. ZYX-F-186]|uniref:non-specific serine/threonine protein kinase n=1 Tax=Phytohabitans maris TaxID=3071409 RepID=A0ABU0ZZE8_9ACTN|nr:serine/threonine-protein kinase [Phytohabitans sp. ZYX-F-186]MDQ7911347.1 serine/threonine-protein kinase [Phytohabitans sp. ZYX-F-186]
MSPTPTQLVADRYRLLEPLGQGGMGRVWKASDEVLHRDVAIKELVPPPGLTTEERQEMRERSLREARAIARLNNANVVRIFDVLRTDGDPWIVMEYVPSRSLQDVLANDGPVSPTRAAEIGIGVLGALRAAHRSGVVHRDVKPANVLLAEDGRVVLTDFGLATVPGDPNVTRTGLVLGSPAYIAPERARDGTAGPDADLWSLGATLYAAVEGQSPFARPSAIGTLAALATEPVPTPRRAGALKPVLNGLLRKDPTARIKAEEADRLLRRAAGRRPRATLSLRDGVRRPSTTQRREPLPDVKPTTVVAAAEPPTKVVPESVIEAATKTTEQGEEPTKVAVPAPRLPDDTVLPVVPGKPDETVEEPAEAVPALVPPPAPRLGRVALVAGGALLLVLVLVLIFALNAGGEGEPPSNAGVTTVPAPAATSAAPPPPTTAAAEPTTAAPPTPSAAPTTAGGSTALPAGWRMYTDPTGFSIAVPEGWSQSQEGTMVFFREQGGEGRVLGIDQTDQPKPDPVADWTAQERARRGNYNDYQRVKIEAVDYFDKAADWEWTYTSRNGNRLHVVNRGFITSPNQAYGIYWSTLDSTWAANQKNFALVTGSFRPARD